MTDVKRSYRSPRRHAQAAATRTAIIAAADELFMREGFERTTVHAIAEAAEVSDQTVYNAFGDKVGLLHAVAVEAVESGRDESELLAALAAEQDPFERIRMVARASREVWEQEGAIEIEQLIFGSSSKDPRLEQIARIGLEHKRAANRAAVEIVFPDEVRRDDVSGDDLAAFFTAVDSAATVVTLRALGWDLDRWEAWVEVMLRSFLDPELDAR